MMESYKSTFAANHTMRALTVVILLLMIPGGYALTANATVTANNGGNATTVNTMSCTVSATGTGALSANITWYVDDTPHTSDNETLALQSGVDNKTTSIGDIESSDTSKDETWLCQATVSNGTDTLIVNSSNMTIQNSAPMVTHPTSRQTATEDNAFSITATAWDPDGDPIVSWLSDDLNSSLYGKELFVIQDSGAISFTPEESEIGNHTVALFAGDGDLFGGRNVIFEVVERNDPPVMGSLTDQTATEDEQWTYVVSASDEEDDPITLLNVTDIGTMVFTQLNATHGEFSFTPDYNHKGNHTITVIAHETGNASHNDTASFTLTVNVSNQAPQFSNITDPGGVQGNPYSIDFNATDLDESDLLNFSVSTSCDLTDPWTLTVNEQNATNASATLSASTLNNSHVACREVMVTVRDYEGGVAKDSANITMTLNITNTNDPPVVKELSEGSQNSLEQDNMSNLTAPVDLPFVYDVTADDPDELTYEGENLTYSDNTTIFDIDPATGRISFTPSSTGENLINISVTDDEGLVGYRTMNLTIVANTFPTMDPLAASECQEDARCEQLFSAQDPDVGENLTFSLTLVSASITSNNTPANHTNVSWQSWNTSQFNETYTNYQVGNYTYNVTVKDRYGASDSTLWNVTVNNTNDAPAFDHAITVPEPVVEGYQTSFLINSSDVDFANTEEALTMSQSIGGPNPGLFNPTKISQEQWQVEFTPSTSDDGDYEVNFTVQDDEGASSTQTVTFTVYNQSIAPNITDITPAMNQSGQLSTEWADRNTSSVAVTLQEGNTYSFNITYNDPDTAAGDMQVTWTLSNGTVLQQRAGTADPTYQVTYTYFDSGTYTYIVNVSDDRFESDTFQWNVTVANVNRDPQFISTIPNRSVNQTIAITNYMQEIDGQRVFYDPDDDLDSNGEIDGDETNNLQYSATSTSLMDITFSGEDVTLTPKDTGTAVVQYTATDTDGAMVQSNNVTYNVTHTPDDSQQTTTTSSSGGGGGGGSSAVPVPVQDEPEPITIELLVPKPLTVYYNETILAPIMVRNPSDRVLRGVALSAGAEAENVTFAFSRASFEQLEPLQEVNVSLYITNYRSQGTYEIQVNAMVDDPEVNDTAILYINSLEKGSDGDALQTKVTFARDLVSANPECVELNELVGQAQRAISTGQSAEATKLLNAVVDGCRYLVTEGSRRQEIPSGFDLTVLAKYRHANTVLALLVFVLMGVGALLIWHYRSAAED